VILYSINRVHRISSSHIPHRYRTRIPGVETYSARRVRLEAAQVQRREVDGDQIETNKSMDVEVMPGSLIVCAPQAQR
jgi:diacylglycerol kinase family enzyme